MYSVGDLAKRYKVTRQTIYNKFKEEILHPYIVDNEGKKLLPEGINTLTMLLADGKVGQQVDAKLETSRQPQIDTKDVYFDKYVKLLEDEIKELKNENKRLQELLFQMMEQKLLESKEQKKKKGLFGWFSK